MERETKAAGRCPVRPGRSNEHKSSVDLFVFAAINLKPQPNWFYLRHAACSDAQHVKRLGRGNLVGLTAPMPDRDTWTLSSHQQPMFVPQYILMLPATLIVRGALCDPT